MTLGPEASKCSDGNPDPFAPTVFGHGRDLVVGMSSPFRARGVLVAGEAGETEGRHHKSAFWCPMAAENVTCWGKILPKMLQVLPLAAEIQFFTSF